MAHFELFCKDIDHFDPKLCGFDRKFSPEKGKNWHFLPILSQNLDFSVKMALLSRVINRFCTGICKFSVIFRFLQFPSRFINAHKTYEKPFFSDWSICNPLFCANNQFRTEFVFATFSKSILDSVKPAHTLVSNQIGGEKGAKTQNGGRLTISSVHLIDSVSD